VQIPRVLLLFQRQSKVEVAWYFNLSLTFHPSSSAFFSAIIITVKWVLAHGTVGMTEASMTRNASTPCTRQWLSTTERWSSEEPIRQVLLAC